MLSLQKPCGTPSWQSALPALIGGTTARRRECARAQQASVRARSAGGRGGAARGHLAHVPGGGVVQGGPGGGAGEAQVPHRHRPAAAAGGRQVGPPRVHRHAADAPRRSLRSRRCCCGLPSLRRHTHSHSQSWNRRPRPHERNRAEAMAPRVGAQCWWSSLPSLPRTGKQADLQRYRNCDHSLDFRWCIQDVRASSRDQQKPAGPASRCICSAFNRCVQYKSDQPYPSCLLALRRVLCSELI